MGELYSLIAIVHLGEKENEEEEKGKRGCATNQPTPQPLSTSPDGCFMRKALCMSKTMYRIQAMGN